MGLTVCGAFGGLESGFAEKLIAFWTAKSRGKKPGACSTLTSYSVKGSKVSHFVRFK